MNVDVRISTFFSRFFFRKKRSSAIRRTSFIELSAILMKHLPVSALFRTRIPAPELRVGLSDNVHDSATFPPPAILPRRSALSGSSPPAPRSAATCSRSRRREKHRPRWSEKIRNRCSSSLSSSSALRRAPSISRALPRFPAVVRPIPSPPQPLRTSSPAFSPP